MKVTAAGSDRKSAHNSV